MTANERVQVQHLIESMRRIETKVDDTGTRVRRLEDRLLESDAQIATRDRLEAKQRATVLFAAGVVGTMVSVATFLLNRIIAV